MMSERRRLEESAVQNERSLRTLLRAIALSQGQFSLILVRCNYVCLQQQMMQQLKERSDVALRELTLSESVTTLYPAIQAKVWAYRFAHQAGVALPAMVISGLESVAALDQLLASTNQLRDEFRTHFPFPLVLWVTDGVLQKLIRFAPDFKSWAAGSIGFSMTTEELGEFLQQQADAVLNQVLASRNREWPNHSVRDLPIGTQQRLELESALEDLQRRGQLIEPELRASLEFVRGYDDYATDQIESSIAHLQQSLLYWQQAVRRDENCPHLLYLERQGIALLYLGRCYTRWANQQPTEQHHYWKQARDSLQQCIQVFEEAHRSDLVAQFISELGEVLRHLEAWSDLQALTQKALLLHRLYHNPIQLAQDYGFLAEVAQAQSNWENVHQYAKQALFTLGQHPTPESQRESFYLLLLANSQQHLGQRKGALHSLELALDKCDHQYDPQLYIRILEALRRLYFVQGEYLEAFRIKQERRSIEQQYGFRAFIGAGLLQPHRHTLNPALASINLTDSHHPVSVSREIVAAGRQQDVNRLIERISRNDHKLIVIHGPSGVGKSSIVTAGLVPALQLKNIGTRDVLPVILQSYTDWSKEVGRLLTEALKHWQVHQCVRSGMDTLSDGSSDSAGLVLKRSDGLNLPTFPLANLQSILAQLRQNGENNLLTVLIFDQFEEFFFACTKPAEQRRFYEFLHNCLNTPFVKVILSLRDDSLHYLLEVERLRYLEAINNDILNQKTRYYLGNFSQESSRKLIKNLTESTPFFHLEPALIDQLVEDLGGELGEVRPIELQLVGAQLQEDRIHTLKKYQQLGPNPKLELVERFLKKVIADCGPENEAIAWKVLFVLADETGTRPLKTKQELTAALPQKSGKAALQELSQLELVLEILVGSGLVFMLWEESEVRYQLIHDYLVERIRQKAELHLKTQLKKSEEKLNRVQKQQLRTFAAGLLMTILTVAASEFAWRAEAQRKRAVMAETNAQLSALSASAEALFASHKELDSLIESIKAGVKLQYSLGVTPDTQLRVVTALQQAVYGVQERNRLEGHRDVIWGVDFSPNGQLIASASTDQTVKLWHSDGQELSTLKGHQDSVTSVSFSPGGQLLASASLDKTIKLWKIDQRGKFEAHPYKTLIGHTHSINSVSFSPDGQLLASGSDDQTVRLWNANTGHLLKTLKQTAKVTAVSFSLDGQLLASTSEDNMIKLWDAYTGRLLTLFKGHTGKVTHVAFSPDGQLLASTSDDKTVRLWSRTGQLLKTLRGHTKWVFSVSFSPDSQLIASASEDNTVRVWRRNGTLLTTFEGHSDGVTSVRFSPDGQTVVSGSYDKTVKLWHLKDQSRLILQGHRDQVTNVSFSPDGQSLASASQDKTVKLWKRDGKLLTTLKGHIDRIDSVNFSPDNQLIASASRDKTIKLWNRQGKFLRTLNGHQDWVLDVTFSPDSQLIASASRDKTVKLWNRSGMLIETLNGHRSRVNSTAFSPDGQLLVTASDDNTVKLWTSDGKGGYDPYKTLQGHHGWVLDVAFSPNGQLIASASYDNTVKLWRRDGSLFRTLEGHTDSVAHVSFSPDGQILATISWENTVQLWRLDDTLIKALPGHGDQVTSVSFSPDGKLLASASKDKTVILWNLDLDNLLVRGCNWVENYLQNNAKVRDRDRHLCDN